MKITDTADNTIDKDKGTNRRILINYPQTEGLTAAEKRINVFILKIVSDYKKQALNAPLYTYNRLKYKVCRNEPLSLFFESESMGADGLFSYIPFSVTFSSDGCALPLAADKKTLHGAKKFFAGYGVKLSRRDMKYSYYINDNSQTVIYAKTPSARRAKRSIAEYRI